MCVLAFIDDLSIDHVKVCLYQVKVNHMFAEYVETVLSTRQVCVSVCIKEEGE